MRVLLVEDDTLLGDGIRAGLRQDGYVVDWFTNGEEAEAALAVEAFDLMVLDLGLPGRDGLEVLNRLRRKGSEVPVLILTARDTVADRVKGLDVGGDDYMVKPFDLDELSARARALIRRSKGRASPKLEIGGLMLDPAAHEVRYEGHAIDLSPKEFAVLQTLMENVGKVVSRSRLQDSIYGWEQDVESNTVEVHVHHLRKKLSSKLIRTIRGVGYMVEKQK